MSVPHPTPSIDSLLQTLSTSYSLHARPSVLQTILTNLLNSAHPPSGPGLIQSLKFRLLASDITVSLQPYANLCLPPTLPDSAPIATTLSRDGIVVQILDITDLTSSRGDALDRLEMVERGEAMRGREVIRIVPGENENGEGPGAGGGGATRAGGRSMHKLLLEDAAGRRVWGFELTPVTSLKVGMNIGAKVLLRGCTVARGVVLMTAGTATVLGGKVDALQKAWIDGRKEVLLVEIENLRREN